MARLNAIFLRISEILATRRFHCYQKIFFCPLVADYKCLAMKSDNIVTSTGRARGDLNKDTKSFKVDRRSDASHLTVLDILSNCSAVLVKSRDNQLTSNPFKENLIFS